MHGEFQRAQLVIHQWHLSDKCCTQFPCPEQYTGWNMLIQASACKCFRSEVRALSSTKIVQNILYLNINFQSGQQLSACSAVHQNEVKSSLFCLDFFHYTVNNRDRRCYWSLRPMPTETKYTEVTCHHIFTPLPYNSMTTMGFGSFKLDYKLSGLQSVHNIDTDMTERLLEVGVCWRELYASHNTECELSLWWRGALKLHQLKYSYLIVEKKGIVGTY